MFFRTLADTHGAHSAAIVLSGADGDGAIGIKRIKERGGLTVVQDPERGRARQMPRAAIATGMVDWVLPVAEMPARLRRLLAHRERGCACPPRRDRSPRRSRPGRGRRHRATRRRCTTFWAFCARGPGAIFPTTSGPPSCGASPGACRSTASRTSGLPGLPAHAPGRDRRAVAGPAHLASPTSSATARRSRRWRRMIPSSSRQGPDDTVRVWVGGVRHGRGGVLRRHAALRTRGHAGLIRRPSRSSPPTGRERHRAGRARALPGDDHRRRERGAAAAFFHQGHGGYRVKREVREIVLFALHDLLKDSPFSRLDLVSCRNLLIYLNRDAQERALDIFHFALRPGGMLFLGSSESVDDASPLFAAAGQEAPPLSAQRARPERAVLPVPTGPEPSLRAGCGARMPDGRPRCGRRGVRPAGTRAVPALPGRSERQPVAWERAALHRPSSEFGAPSVIVNQEHEIVHLSGRRRAVFAFQRRRADDQPAAAGAPDAAHRTARGALPGGAVRRGRGNARPAGGDRRASGGWWTCASRRAARRARLPARDPAEREAADRPPRRWWRRRGERSRPSVTWSGNWSSPRRVARHGRAIRGAPGGTQGLQRRAAGHERGAAFHHRGNGNGPRGTPIDQRGAEHRQPGAEKQGGGTQPLQQRPAKPDGRHGHRHDLPGPRSCASSATRRRPWRSST